MGNFQVVLEKNYVVFRNVHVVLEIFHEVLGKFYVLLRNFYVLLRNFYVVLGNFNVVYRILRMHPNPKYVTDMYMPLRTSKYILQSQNITTYSLN